MIVPSLSITLNVFSLLRLFSNTYIVCADTVILGGDSIGIVGEYNGLYISGTYTFTYHNKTYNSKDYFFNTLKILNDGTPEAKTGALTEPYPENGQIVPPVFVGDEFAEIGIETAKAGFDIHIHAIGDKAILETLSYSVENAAGAFVFARSYSPVL